MKAVLFDLDGTLLETSFDTLLHEYFNGISLHFEQWIAPEVFIKQLLASTDVMLANEDLERTNIQVFSEDFFCNTNLDPKLIAEFDRYYHEEFPKLSYLAKANPIAREIVELAFAKNLKVVIATNPLFPEIAIVERLKWANIADFPYDLITSADNMHACKPNLRYFEEICEKIAVDPKDCLMIGDDPVNDGPAEEIGIETIILDEELTLADIKEMLAQRS